MSKISLSSQLRLTTAKEAAQAGAAVLTRYFATGLKASRKPDDSLVTIADVEAEQAVLEVIKASFPNDSILAEESGEPHQRRPGAWVWVIDPLDGTSNFYYGLPYFCCSVAAGKVRPDGSVHIQYAAVAAPCSQELFFAAEGQGAFCDGRKLDLTGFQPKPFAHYFLGTGLYYGAGERLERDMVRLERITRQCQAIRRMGAAALDLCLVAKGTFDGFWQEGLQAWDVAAAALIIQEAGGRIESFDRKAPYNIEARSIVAGPADVVDSLRELI